VWEKLGFNNKPHKRKKVKGKDANLL